jgi:hypothetical protein
LPIQLSQHIIAYILDPYAQALASQYLNADALTCYWLTLLSRMAALQKYKPGRAHRCD